MTVKARGYKTPYLEKNYRTGKENASDKGEF